MAAIYQSDFFDKGPDGTEVREFATSAAEDMQPVTVTVELPAGVVRFLALNALIREQGGYTTQAHDLVLGAIQADAAFVRDRAAAWLRDCALPAIPDRLETLTIWPEIVSLIADERRRADPDREAESR